MVDGRQATSIDNPILNSPYEQPSRHYEVGQNLPDIYFYTGHGICQNPPAATDPGFVVVCGNFGSPNVVNIGSKSRWGNAPGKLKFLFLDASCPMDLVSLASNWFPVFGGLHIGKEGA